MTKKNEKLNVSTTAVLEDPSYGRDDALDKNDRSLMYRLIESSSYSPTPSW
ncbi:hypothetical protein [Pedobacter sp. SYSU D00535]|uniref:hypothetical protein n=1 Tax=Pedobacter sp. SYSU D00535 TaxID=2810308 RepID=UPI001A96C526|nr:hypothetical protein [Pedobacter sp. SYSU D00535]